VITGDTVEILDHALCNFTGLKPAKVLIRG
jgi:hypothetical protein